MMRIEATLVLTYIILLICVLFLVIKWISFYRRKKKIAPPAQLDNYIVSSLNRREENHGV